MRTTISRLARVVGNALDEKLGRCGRCIRLSVALAALSWVLVAGSAAIRTAVFMEATLVAAAAFTMLSTVHGVAYLVRPERPARCVPCARAKRRRRRKAERVWSRLARPLRRSNQNGARGGGRRCAACAQKPSVDALVAAADTLPPADDGLRAVVESSDEFAGIRPWLRTVTPADTWQANGEHHFVYHLQDRAYGPDASALFTIRWEDYAPLAAVVVVPSGEGAPATIDLRDQLAAPPSYTTRQRDA